MSTTAPALGLVLVLEQSQRLRESCLQRFSHTWQSVMASPRLILVIVDSVVSVSPWPCDCHWQSLTAYWKTWWEWLKRVGSWLRLSCFLESAIVSFLPSNLRLYYPLYPDIVRWSVWPKTNPLYFQDQLAIRTVCFWHFHRFLSPIHFLQSKMASGHVTCWEILPMTSFSPAWIPPQLSKPNTWLCLHRSVLSACYDRASWMCKTRWWNLFDVGWRHVEAKSRSI